MGVTFSNDGCVFEDFVSLLDMMAWLMRGSSLSQAWNAMLRFSLVSG